MNDDQVQAVRAALEEDGWVFDRIVASACLPIATAAGGRDAIASLRIPGQIQWEFVSEGRNVLATSTTAIAQASTPEQAATIVEDTLVHVRNAIDNSYARRLFLKYPKPEENKARLELLESINAQLAQGTLLVMMVRRHIWFVRSDGLVRLMERFQDGESASRRFWHSDVGALPDSVLSKKQCVSIEDPLVQKYASVCPDLRDWLLAS